MAELQLWFAEMWIDLQQQFYVSFIVDNRWKYITTGLQNTIIITFFALIMGVVLGVVVAGIRASYDTIGKDMQKGFKKSVLVFFNTLSKIYLTVVRGTPVMVQILIIFFIIMATSDNKVLCAVVAFGLNSGAYVAEIIRSGIMSIDKGQMEAGRSLGMNYMKTMWFVVLPQAFKNILPALANEFIVLIKETSIAGYVGVTELTRGANIIRGVTFQSAMPLLAVALIYLIIVMFFTKMVEILERKLRNSER